MTAAWPDVPVLLPDEWVVCFEPTTSIWWGRLLAPQFGHCFMMGCVVREEGETPVWLLVEPLTVGTQVGVMAPEVVLTMFARARRGEMRMLACKPEKANVVRPRFLVTCAGCVASVLGLRRYPLTPRGLFWTLRRAGARELCRT